MLKRIGFIGVVFFVLISLANAATLDDQLMVAAEKGDVKGVRSLLQKGANPNAANTDGNTLTALILAAQEGHAGVVRLLVEAGAKVNTTAAQAVGVYGVSEGITALGKAVRSGDPTTVEILLNHKADPNAIQVYKEHDDNGNDTMHVVQSAPIVLFAVNAAVLRLLVEHGANPNAKDNDDYTLLMCAAQYLDAKAVTYLLSKGVDPREKNKEGLTAMDFAKKAGKKENLRILEKAVTKK